MKWQFQERREVVCYTARGLWKKISQLTEKNITKRRVVLDFPDLFLTVDLYQLDA